MQQQGSEPDLATCWATHRTIFLSPGVIIAAVSGDALTEEHSIELRKEAYAMALYVSIVLLASLTLLRESEHASQSDILTIIWGTTVGLALAHFLAFRLASRLVAGRVRKTDSQIALVQVAAALAVALAVTLPVLLLPTTSELDVGRLLLAGALGVAAYLGFRGGGHSHGRAIAVGLLALVVGMAIAAAKNILSGH